MSLHKTVPITILVGLLVLSSVSMQTDGYSNPGITVVSPAWTITIGAINTTVPVGSSATLYGTIVAHSTSYNIKINVEANGLTVSGGGSSKSISFNQLNANDVRQFSFQISIPSSAPIGNQYNISVSASSYSTPAGPGGLRAFWDTPAYQGSGFVLIQAVASPGPNIQSLELPVGIGLVAIIAVIAIFFALKRSNSYY